RSNLPVQASRVVDTIPDGDLRLRRPHGAAAIRASHHRAGFLRSAGNAGPAMRRTTFDVVLRWGSPSDWYCQIATHPACRRSDTLPPTQSTTPRRSFLEIVVSHASQSPPRPRTTIMRLTSAW